MNPRHKAIEKATGKRFESNSFAKRYKERNEARESTKASDKIIKSIPASLRRK